MGDRLWPAYMQSTSRERPIRSEGLGTSPPPCSLCLKRFESCDYVSYNLIFRRCFEEMRHCDCGFIIGIS